MTEKSKDPALFPYDGEGVSDDADTSSADGRAENPREAAAAGDGPACPDAGDGAGAEKRLPPVLPVLPVRDVVVFNYMILPLFISREKSVKAVEAALRRGRQLLVVAQREEGVEDPGPADLYQTGTVVQVMRMLKMPDSRIKVLVQGVSRARVLGYRQAEPYLEARVAHVDEASVARGADVEALLRAVREQSEKVLSLRGISSPDILGVLQSVDEPGRLADIIAANLHMKMAEAQAILEAVDPVERLRLVHERLQHELEVATVQARIQGAAREGMDKAQKEYFLREQLKAIRHELGDGEDDAEDDMASLKEALDKAGLSAEARTEADRQLRRLSAMHADSSEASVLRAYLEWLADLPWKKQSRDRLDIARARDILDEDHCGLEKVKERILEFLSVRKLNPRSKGSILCFSGPPGVGKTSLGRSIARALGRKFQRLSLGGMHDEAEIRGHRRTYIGAMPGRILQALRQAGTRNPVMVLDEVDKLGADFRGDPSSALLEVLDPEQNNTFSDHYLNVPFDLSRVLFICTANHVDSIPAALRDRMEVITLPGYTRQEKAEIGKRHLLPKRVADTGLKEGDVRLTDAAMDKIIAEYTREAGVRNLERELGAVCRKLARRKAEGARGPFRVTPAEVEKLLGAPRFVEDESEAELDPGMALGLAWTAAGGEVLTVEASAVKGKGALLLTGQLGDVMKESAQAAMSYIRSRAEALGLDPAFAARHDIHIHVPAGATPKDGPSAGVTLTTALISALTGRRARADLCMTGEITLRGRVLPVGGIKEKILAGVARGLKHVIIPHQNVKDLEDVPKELLRRIKVHPVQKYDEVLPLAFADAAPDKAAGRGGEKAAKSAPPAAPRRRRATRLPDRPSA
ncbi:endopeptidase La [Desulfovibrio sp.]|uniref:endopeptidase La n=1 Tax=Desulfovibrio sp. TaxID=885 RepID=UPI0023D6B4B7|nr:endopeptidase La [Desulfovibrio sp.]MDE7241263.1 endopeptidase La [Desulfovibrio sp.]